MAYFRFFLTHPRILSFGVLLTLFSSFGQTFLISIFVPDLLESFSLNTAQFGALYAGATLTSAVTLPFFGRMMDRVPLRPFALLVGLGLVFACIAMALAHNSFVLFVAILALRLTGQGLMSLTAATAMARFFDQGRGKALSVSALGYPLGEGLLPLAIVLLIHAVGWRISWGILALVVGLVLLPAIASLLHGFEGNNPSRNRPATNTSKGSLLKDHRFYLLIPGTLFIPLVLTALFLYQIPLAEFRGWTTETMAAAFIGFAIARMLFSLVAGQAIDRWGALRLLPWTLAPLAFGLLVLAFGHSPQTAFVYLFLAGVSQGMSSPTMTALWAEIYGVEAIGAVKSLFATLGIFATALGPLLLGWLLKHGIPFTKILPGCFIAALLIVTLNTILSRQGTLAPPVFPITRHRKP